MASQHNILVHAPFDYYPRDEGGEFIDDITEITSTLFKESGVKCGCGSKKIHRNKYSFQQQHLSNKMHQKWLNSLNQKRIDILKERAELKKEIRDIRARETRARNIEIRLRNELNDKQKLIEHQKKELLKQLEIIKEHRTDIEQMSECLQECTKQISIIDEIKKTNNELKKTNKILETKINTNSSIIKNAEVLAVTILKHIGYDIE